MKEAGWTVSISFSNVDKELEHIKADECAK